MNWLPIETAPGQCKPSKMFAVIANTITPQGIPYTTDPYYVWRVVNGFVRWPHPFPPTHWHPMPEFDKLI